MRPSNNQTTLVGLAGACAVLFFESVFHTVNTDPHFQGVTIFAAIVLATFSVYALAFQCFNFLDQRYLWRLRGQVYLGGRWTSALTNLFDQSERSGEVYIRHTRDSIDLTGVNSGRFQSRV